jgi:hypothetical protein
MLLWAPVDLMPDGASACGYSRPGRNPLRCSLTSGIRVEGRKKPGKTSSGHMVTGEPVNVSGGSH